MTKSNKSLHLTAIEGGLSSGSGEKFRSKVLRFDSGGGEPPVDAETKHYVDANVRAMSAENNASLSKLEAKIDAIQPGMTWQQNLLTLASAIAVTLGLIFAVLAYASDRFDSGVAAMGAIEEALDVQRETNAAQDARLEKILEALEANNKSSVNEDATGK